MSLTIICSNCEEIIDNGTSVDAEHRESMGIDYTPVEFFGVSIVDGYNGTLSSNMKASKPYWVCKDCIIKIPKTYESIQNVTYREECSSCNHYPVCKEELKLKKDEDCQHFT